jgi:hypothetical protein
MSSTDFNKLAMVEDDVKTAETALSSQLPEKCRDANLEDRRPKGDRSGRRVNQYGARRTVRPSAPQSA